MTGSVITENSRLWVCDFYVSKVLDNVTSVLLPSRKVSEQDIQQILQQHHLVQPLEKNEKEYPNIIIVMEESFGTLII